MIPKYYFFNDAVTQFFFVFAHNTSVVGYTHIARNRVSGLYRGAYSIQHQLCNEEIVSNILKVGKSKTYNYAYGKLLKYDLDA